MVQRRRVIGEANNSNTENNNKRKNKLQRSYNSSNNKRNNVSSSAREGGLHRLVVVIGSFIVVLMGSLILLGLNKHFGGGFFNEYIDQLALYRTQKMNISQILLKHVEVVDKLIMSEGKLKSLLTEEPLAEFLKESLRPVQERLASIRTQTSQYEKMERIPGGPTHFISTSLAELNKIMHGEMVHLSAQVLLIMQEYQNRVQEAAESAKSVVSSHSQIMTISEDSFKRMISEGIYLLPLEGWDAKANAEKTLEFIQSSSRNHSLTTVSRKLYDLALLYQKREPIQFVIQQFEEYNSIFLSKELNPLELENAVEELADVPDLKELIFKFVEIQEQIVEEVEKNSQFYQLIIPLNRLQIDKIQQTMPQLHDIDSKKRAPYIRLHSMILEDIRKLMVRIQNMQYKYIKIQDS